MEYTKEMKKAVAEQVAAMLDNDVINENGFEPFEVWCNDGEVFANMDEEADPDFINACMNLVRELAPMVDAIHANLSEDELYPPPGTTEKKMRTKSFADIHDQVERFNRLAPTGYRWQKIEAIANRYYDNIYDYFGSYDATFKNDCVKLPREVYAKQTEV